MPNPLWILATIGAALAASTVALVLFGWRGRKAGTSGVDIGWVVGPSAGLFLGCCVLGKIPRWPPTEDLDRLLLIVLPAVILVELVGAFHRVPRPLVWLLRAALAACVAPILLHGTDYITDQGGPGTAQWSTAQAGLILSGLAAALITVWALLGLLSARAGGLVAAFCLAISSGGAGLAIMISGYLSGGQATLALAGAVAGLIAATLALAWSSRGARPLGAAIVFFYSLIVTGRFFGELSTAHAIILFASPLLGWLPELPPLRRLPRWARELTRVLLVGLVVSAVVADDVRMFIANTPASDDSGFDEPIGPDGAGPEGVPPDSKSP
jgi:hypothetical protein